MRNVIAFFTFLMLISPVTVMSADQDDPIKEWSALQKKSNVGNISRKDAFAKILDLCGKLDKYFIKMDGSKYSREMWVFPVSNGFIGDLKNAGFNPAGYDFLWRKKPKNHPAFDLFVNDKDRDGIDDTAGFPFEILSMSSGVVLETNEKWVPKSKGLGGNYVWIYDTATRGIFYYAHLNDVFVKAGEVVIAGQMIGLLGRTGKNAYHYKSPTHLHLMYLKITDKGPFPENIHADLDRCLKAKKN